MEERPKFTEHSDDHEPEAGEVFIQPEIPKTENRENIFGGALPNILAKEISPPEETYFEKKHEVRDEGNSPQPLPEVEAVKDPQLSIPEEQGAWHIGEVLEQKKEGFGGPVPEPSSRPEGTHEDSTTPPLDDQTLYTQAVRTGFMAAIAVIFIILLLRLL